MLEKVIEIIQEQLNLEGVAITEDSSFKDDLGADSLDLFELVMAVEEEYGVEIFSRENCYTKVVMTIHAEEIV